MYVNYSLDQLTAFIAVVEEGSFSAAGRRLGRVQSAVSYAIQQLEEGLGTQLFDRSGRMPTLTEAGRRVASEAKLVLGQARELADCAAQLSEGVEAELRVALDAVYPRQHLVEICADFGAAFPATVLRLDVGLLGDVVALVRDGGADLAACNLAHQGVPQLSTVFLGTVMIVPVCAATHALAGAPAPQDEGLLRQHTQIVHSERAPSTTADQGVLASRTWRVTDLALKVHLIEAGVGWGSLPLTLAQAGIDAGTLIQLQPRPWPPNGHRLSLHAVARADLPLGQAGQWFRHRLELSG